ncbi:MAG: glycoside hydrolase family 18, partial [Anaerocolumna sp.]|nr:glycoside hydrolase family 18 [Anaerocolumna sp.]
MKQLKKIVMVLLSLALLVTMVPAGTGTVKAASGKNIVAYFPNWGIYNSAHRSITVGMIPWEKITVINHAFFEVDSSFKLASTDTFADFDKMMDHSEGWDTNQLRGHFGEYKYYKNLYPNVKVIVSVGGWTRGQNFHAMALTSSSRAVFIQSVVDFLKKYPFIDGIDLDWEYPGVNRAADPNDQYDRGCPGGPEDKQNFTSLLREIRQAYNNNGLSGKLLTIAVPSGYDKLALQEPDVYAQYLDWLNVMTYDMHGAWETTTNHQS